MFVYRRGWTTGSPGTRRSLTASVRFACRPTWCGCRRSCWKTSEIQSDSYFFTGVETEKSPTCCHSLTSLFVTDVLRLNAGTWTRRGSNLSCNLCFMSSLVWNAERRWCVQVLAVNSQLQETIKPTVQFSQNFNYQTKQTKFSLSPKNFGNDVSWRSSVTTCLYFCLLSPSVTTPSSRWPTTVTYWCIQTVSATGYLPPSSAPPAPSASSTSPSTGRTAHSSSRKELEADRVVVYLVCSFM